MTHKKDQHERSESPIPRSGAPGLDTDLYQLTMMAAYIKSGKAGKTATFELFVRSLPPGWGYLVACGLEGALDFLEEVSYEDAQVDWLAGLDVFSGVDERVFEALRKFRFEATYGRLPKERRFLAKSPSYESPPPSSRRRS